MSGIGTVVESRAVAVDYHGISHVLAMNGKAIFVEVSLRQPIHSLHYDMAGQRAMDSTWGNLC